MNRIDTTEKRIATALRLGSLVIGEAIAQLFAGFVKLSLVSLGGRMLQLGNDQIRPFLAYRVAGRDVKHKEQEL